MIKNKILTKVIYNKDKFNIHKTVKIIIKLIKFPIRFKQIQTILL